MNDFIFNESGCGCVIQASRTMTVFPGTKEPFTLAPQQMLLLPRRYDVRFSHGAMSQVLHLSRDIVSDFLQYIVTDKGLSTVTPRNTPDYLVEMCPAPSVFEEAARLSDGLSECPVDKARRYSLAFLVISRFLSHHHAKALLRRMMVSRLSDDVYRQVYQFPREVWSLSRMARCFTMSDSLLKKRLHEEGSCYTRLVMGARMQVAMKCLIRGCRNITNIATQCGYHSTSYFIAIFRKYYGLSPYQYQKKIISEGRQKTDIK
ncbi:TPA: helix-turn-helix domain-containing protein [Salmonella enterica subsp. enterica serovar Welikade]|nr:helix-turn-helix domain-containing protein [Salmonella enterica subsp. enterica serovar Poona]EHZ8150418.1 helix-turn-helix domain-containing protein [Salmonella enterica]EHZ8203391.1 helix-turn-helix domain-containing protein [Salmonella enterica]HBI5523319.1 helix-turn-helix domain-containing protein [Salmonella enterica subsp. enterica serovar Welikade]